MKIFEHVDLPKLERKNKICLRWNLMDVGLNAKLLRFFKYSQIITWFELRYKKLFISVRYQLIWLKKIWIFKWVRCTQMFGQFSYLRNYFAFFSWIYLLSLAINHKDEGISKAWHGELEWQFFLHTNPVVGGSALFLIFFLIPFRI